MTSGNILIYFTKKLPESLFGYFREVYIYNLSFSNIDHNIQSRSRDERKVKFFV